MSQLCSRILYKCRLFPFNFSWRKYSKNYADLPSALYMDIKNKTKYLSAVDPHIEVESAFKDLEKMKEDLITRNVKIDLDQLYKNGLVYERLREYIKELQDQIYIVNRALKHRDKEDKTEKITSLKDRFNELVDRLNEAKEQLSAAEDKFVYPFLALPNSLHKNTGPSEEVIFSLFTKPEFSSECRSHAQIGTTNGEIQFENVSPTSYYLKGNLAMLEMAVTDYLLDQLRKFGFRNNVNMDFAKANLAEGCGLKVKGGDMLTVNAHDCTAFNQVPFLLGGTSLASFVAMLCKSQLTFDSIAPLKLVAAGRKYELSERPSTTETLFNCCQSSCVSALIAYPCDAVEETVFNETAMYVIHLYTELGLHFQLVQCAAVDLKPHECLAVKICMFSPFSNEYVEVGRISLCQDFISRRLQIYQSLGENRAAFLGMIFVEMMNVRDWLACMMENTQQPDGTYTVPNCLQPFML